VKKISTQKEERPQRYQGGNRQLHRAVFSSRGAALKSFQLKKYQKECIKCVKDYFARNQKTF